MSDLVNNNIDIEQTQEERIAWLRERNVEIEFPSDRKKNSTQHIIDKKNIQYVKIVKIPCNISEPYKEINIPIDITRKGEQLQDLLGIYFNQGKVNLKDLTEQSPTTHLTYNIDQINLNSTSNSTALSQDTVDSLVSKGSVELFTIAYPHESNEYLKVSFYLDEVGQIKKLDRNIRAIQLARLCGFQNVPLVGDIFVSRMKYNKDNQILGHIDFNLIELDSNALWLHNIEKYNYDYGLLHNKVSMDPEANHLEECHSSIFERNISPQYNHIKWTETSDYIEVIVTIPNEINKFILKDLTITIKSNQIIIKIKNNTLNTINQPILIDSNMISIQPNEDILLCDSILKGYISVDDSTWSINKQQIELSLEKSSRSKGLWKKLEM